MSNVNPQAANNPDKPEAIPLSRLPRALFSRRWWWTTLLVIVGMIVLFRLGIWQLDRLQQRRARNAEYLQQISAPPLHLTGDELAADPAELRDRQVEMQGTYDFSEQLILVLQNWQGRPGAHLITPLLIGEGGVAVLVDRGWIPTADVEAGDFTQFEESGEKAVSGVIQLSQTLPGGRETIVEGRQREWYRIDVKAIQKQMPYPLLPFYVLESPSDNTTGQLPYRIENEIDLSDGPHLFYAIQWFIFTLMLGVGYLYFVKTRS
jgi:surfeit locus 1 family protein